MIRELGFEVTVAVQISVTGVVGRLAVSQMDGDGGVATAWREARGRAVVSVIWRLSASSDPHGALVGDSSG